MLCIKDGLRRCSTTNSHINEVSVGTSLLSHISILFPSHSDMLLVIIPNEPLAVRLVVYSFEPLLSGCGGYSQCRYSPWPMLANHPMVLLDL